MHLSYVWTELQRVGKGKTVKNQREIETVKYRKVDKRQTPSSQTKIGRLRKRECA